MPVVAVSASTVPSLYSEAAFEHLHLVRSSSKSSAEIEANPAMSVSNSAPAATKSAPTMLIIDDKASNGPCLPKDVGKCMEGSPLLRGRLMMRGRFP